MSVSFCLPHPVAVSAFTIYRGLCACTEMLWMCVLYVSFGSKVRPRTFGCVAMGSALLFIVRSRLLVYSAGSGVNRVQVVLSGFGKRLFCFVQAMCKINHVNYICKAIVCMVKKGMRVLIPIHPCASSSLKEDQRVVQKALHVNLCTQSYNNNIYLKSNIQCT